MYWKIYKNIIQTNVIQTNVIQTNVIQTNVIQSAFWWRTHWILWLHEVFREILSLIFEFQPDLTLARIMCCKMANNTLKILWCSHRKIFLSMFGHFTTLCMKGLRSIPSKPTSFLKSSLHLFQKRCLICLHLLSS